jgi:hypothetical protein
MKEDPRVGRALGAIEEAREAQSVYRLTGEYLAARQKQLDREMFATIESDPNWEKVVARLALQKLEVWRFLRNMEQLMKSGISAGKLLTPLMELHANERES